MDTEELVDILTYYHLQEFSSGRDGMVAFRYRHAKSGEALTRTVKGEYFLYLLMLHVLPQGFRRARSYGFFHTCSTKLVRLLQLVLRAAPWRALVRNLKQRPTIPGSKSFFL